MRYDASVSAEDRQADLANGQAKRLVQVEGVAHRHLGIGGARPVYAIFGWLSTQLPTPAGIGGSALNYLSITQALRVGDVIRLDGQARIGGNSGATGFIRVALSVVSPASALTDLVISDSQCSPLAAGGFDTNVPIEGPEYVISTAGTWTFLLRAQILLGSGTWVMNNNLSILRAEICAPYS